MKSQINKLLEIYESIRPQIEQRLAGFQNIRENGSEFELYKELIFCLLTPQSNAERCWLAVEKLERKNLLFCNDPIKNRRMPARLYKISSYKSKEYSEE